MTTKGSAHSGLTRLFKASDLGWLLAKNSEYIHKQMKLMVSVFDEKSSGIVGFRLPTPTTQTLLKEQSRNPHRVKALLQALAFRCSPEMLAMLWMVQCGASVLEIQYKHQRRQKTKLSVTLQLDDQETEISFESINHWDTAILRLATLAKSDDHPVIDNFAALHIPNCSSDRRRALFREQHQGLPLASLTMLKDKLETILKRPHEDYTAVDIAELQDQRLAIGALIAEVS